MGRGRKPISNFNGSEWETVFYNAVGTYVQYINIQLSKEYALEPLSNHLKIVGGYAFKTAEYKNQGIPIIRISDFNNEQIVLKDVVYYQDSKKLEKYQLVEGDIIIALTGGTIAKLAIVQSGLGKIYLNQRVGKFQALKPDEFEVEYIYWLARSIQSIIKNLAWGAAIPNVSPKQIEELKFPFPPKETQRGIIDFLNDLKNNDLKEDKIYFDDLIENEIVALHEKQLTTSSIFTELSHQLTFVKKLRQQLLQDAIQGKLVPQNHNDEPASELLKKIKAEKAKLISEKKTKSEFKLHQKSKLNPPYELPNNWEWVRFWEIAWCFRGHNPEKIHFKKEPGEGYIRFIQITDFKTDENKVYVPISKKLKLVSKGEIVMAAYRHIGKFSREMEGAFNVALCKVNNIEPFSRDFLSILIKSDLITGELLADSERGHIPSMHTGHLLSLWVPVPPLSEQNRIVQKLEELLQYCDELEASIKESESQNEKLLQQVLREALSQEPVVN